MKKFVVAILIALVSVAGMFANDLKVVVQKELVDTFEIKEIIKDVKKNVKEYATSLKEVSEGRVKKENIDAVYVLTYDEGLVESYFVSIAPNQKSINRTRTWGAISNVLAGAAAGAGAGLADQQFDPSKVQKNGLFSQLANERAAKKSAVPYVNILKRTKFDVDGNMISQETVEIDANTKQMFADIKKDNRCEIVYDNKF